MFSPAYSREGRSGRNPSRAKAMDLYFKKGSIRSNSSNRSKRFERLERFELRSLAGSRLDHCHD